MINIFRKELIYAIIIMFGPLNFGFAMGFTSPAIPYFQSHWPSITETQTTLFNALASLFAVFGPYISTFLLRYFGRRMITAIISIASAVIWAIHLAISEKLFALGIAVRCLLGLTIGANSSLGPMCLVEVAPKDMTGFFGNLNQAGVVIGIVWLYLQGVNNSWQSLCITAIVVNAAQAVLIWFIPETSSINKNEEDNKEEEKESESVFQRKYLGKIFVGVMMMVIQQFAGVNALITNLDQNFSDVGVAIASGYCSAISTSAQLVAVFISGLLVDKLGRRPLFCISALGCGICLFIFACNDAFKWTTWLPIVVIFLYMFFWLIPDSRQKGGDNSGFPSF